MNQSTNLLLEINSRENPLRLEIPNPSEDLKKHVIDSILSKYTVFNTIESVETLPPTPMAIERYYGKLKQEEPLPIVPLSGAKDAKPEKVKPSSAEEYYKATSKPSQPTETVSSPVAQGKLYELKERMESRKALEQASEETVKEQDQPTYYTTGIKVRTINGEEVNTYKCRYKCVNNACRNEGNHYIPEHTHKVKCHECGEDLKVERSMTPDGELEKDPYGNFYVAGGRTAYYATAAQYK